MANHLLNRPAPALVRTEGGQTQACLRRHHAEPDLGLFSLSSARDLNADLLGRILRAASDMELSRVRTTSAFRVDHDALRNAGFEPSRQLRVLQRAITHPDPRPSVRVHRYHGDGDDLVDVDHAAFDPFWHIDHIGVMEASAATRHARLRVINEGPNCSGYAITGLSGRTGYIQRLAVDPLHQRHGYGRSLVLDGLRWLQRRGAEEVLVNTQFDNDPAFQLYLGLGFVPSPTELAVFERSL